MEFYVYIIQSSADNSYYKGYSEYPDMRIIQHNNAECNYTSTKMPWVLVYVEELPTKRDALIREKKLKKYSHNQIEQLIASAKNIVTQFL